MCTAVLSKPVEQQPATLTVVERPKPVVETVVEEGNPFTPIIAAFVLAFVGATTLVGVFAAWIYSLRDSGVMAP
jgi:hypothetical protein